MTINYNHVGLFKIVPLEQPIVSDSFFFPSTADYVRKIVFYHCCVYSKNEHWLSPQTQCISLSDQSAM